ncbi:regulatory protein RecX [Ruthenibacterium sp. CLA-JM-H11]|uniref:Regulatory protein RecX n=1 Tax=Ruthenibacterium intestinale TaxID=3133163 RepID=A0ABV1GEM4_9FIRM
MTIGRISETKRGRYALFDESDQFLFSVDDETFVKNHLREGLTLDASALAELQRQSDTRRAKEKALGYLSLRDHSSGELYEKLCRTFDAPSAAAAVAEMRRLGLLDDERFARSRAVWLAGQNKSEREIRFQLERKGVDRDIVDRVMDELAPDETEACCALVRKSYLRKLAGGEREKVLAALARRGFGYGAAKEAVERCLLELEEEREDFE